MKIKKSCKALLLSAILIATLGTTAAFAVTDTSNSDAHTNGTMHTDAFVEEVLKQWDHVEQTGDGTGEGGYNEFDTNQVYMELRYINGYTYTETYKKISTTPQELLGTFIWRYTRTYKTY